MVEVSLAVNATVFEAVYVPPDGVAFVVGGVVSLNVAVTVQLAVIAPVVYVVPLKLPLQPLTEAILKPLIGVTVNDCVAP